MKGTLRGLFEVSVVFIPCVREGQVLLQLFLPIFDMHKGREERIVNLCDEHSAAKLRSGGTA